MKTQILDGEEWPPSVAQTGVQMNYPPDVSNETQFAMGNKFFAMDPGEKTAPTCPPCPSIDQDC